MIAAINKLERPITTSTIPLKSLSISEFGDLVQAHLDGVASDADVEYLAANQRSWVAALLRLYDDAQMALDQVSREVRGPERSLVLADFESERDRIDEVLTQLIGAPTGAADDDRHPSPEEQEPGEPQLQLSWIPGRVVAWSAGHNATPESGEALLERLSAAGAGAVGWE